MATVDVETGRMPDVIRGGRRPQRNPRPSRRLSRKTSEDSEQSTRINVPQVDQRRRTRPGGLSYRQQQARRASESALLPPIRVSTMRQPGTSPTHDANETSSPTSNISYGSVIDVDNALNGIATLFAADTDRSTRGTPRKETRSNLSVAETSETPRPSPVANSDHLRLKAERRVLKSVNDVINDITVGNKTPNIPAEGGIPAPKPTVKSKVSRRISMQSLPKLSMGEEPFSIRRKIEQFKKWHEEQYTDTLKKLKVEAEKEQRGETAKPQVDASSFEIDFAKILEENVKNAGKSVGNKEHRKDANGNPVSQRTENQSTDRPKRCKSSGTWRTWRDANDSYAYNNVTKYIDENELLPPDRVDWIQSWLGDVEKALGYNDNTTSKEVSLPDSTAVQNAGEIHGSNP